MKKKKNSCSSIYKHTGYVLDKNVFVAEPPQNCPTFWLPSKEEIDSLEIGDYVKLIFVDKKPNAERMWVVITKQLESNPVEWVGKLDNLPVFLDSKPGNTVRFPPSAIINYHKKNEPWEDLG